MQVALNAGGSGHGKCRNDLHRRTPSFGKAWLDGNRALSLRWRISRNFVFVRLNEFGLLPRLEMITSVSSGSILSACLGYGQCERRDRSLERTDLVHGGGPEEIQALASAFALIWIRVKPSSLPKAS